jgi:hypothetical protein
MSVESIVMAAQQTIGRLERAEQLESINRDLLAALKRVAAECVNPADGAPYEDGEVPFLDQVRAAIAKAEGEQP